MGDFWSGTTPYDENQSKRDARDAANDRSTAEAARSRLEGYVQKPGGPFEVYGDGATLNETAANLSQVGAMTGQNIYQTGAQQQDYYDSLQKRRNGDDAVAANMMAGRNRNLANVGRQFAGRGVAGGVAAAGMNTATNTADSEINAEKQKFGRQNDAELWNYVKRNQKVTGEALAGGKDSGLADGIDTSQATGVFGTVICSELYRQGMMDHETFIKDMTFGMKLEQTDPHAILGYRTLAAPVVKLMKKSKVFTRIVAVPALAWAENMAGKRNLAGEVITLLGIPFCRFTHRLITGYYFCPEASNAL